MGERLKVYPSLPHLRKRMPIECEACRWRFECNRWSGNPRPYVPERERRVNVSVLDRSAVMGHACPDIISREADQLFPEAYAELNVSLIQALRDTIGEEGLDQVLVSRRGNLCVSSERELLTTS